MKSSDKFISFGLFLSFFATYLYTCASQLPPYRDAGEMATLIETLGVAHPPGYPFYAVFGRLFSEIPLGNVVFRINLFSVLCSAGALSFFYLFLRNWIRPIPAIIAACLLGFSHPFWELANVTEMYALGALWVALILCSIFNLKNPSMTAFLMALGLGARMDMLLLIPIIVAWFYFSQGVRQWIVPAFFFGLGLTIFLYMPIRSLQQPVLDWANPETLGALFDSMTRKNYGSTLDLLSLNYQKGENFLANVSHYSTNITWYLGWWSWIALLVGLIVLLRDRRPVFMFVGACFFITGPLFLYLGNLPPNAHALAIVEAAYPVPTLFLVVVIAFGLDAMMSGKWGQRLLIVLCPLLLTVNAANGYERANKRNNYFVQDYMTNVFRSTPPGSVLVLHEDVQLFSLWYEHLVRGRRKDISLISSGLSNSPWYWEMLKRWKQPPVFPASFKHAKGWVDMKKSIGPRSLLFGQETDVQRSPEIRLSPHGLVSEVQLANKDEGIPYPFYLKDMGIYRGKYKYGVHPDFFSSDLVADYARGLHRWGAAFMAEDQDRLADWFYRWAESMDATFPNPTVNRGFLQFKKKNDKEAYNFYQQALMKHEGLLKLSEEYHSLDSLVRNLKKDLAKTHVYAGVALERQKDIAGARSHYRRAINNFSDPQAHYNLAVTYWDKDWDMVVTHMRRALEINPNMSQAKRFLAQAEYRRRQKSGTSQ